VFPIKNGDKIDLLSWTTKNYLNSHTVAAPMSKRLHEVTGYINHNVGMEGVQLRHVKAEKSLTVTGKTYPDGSWGDGMKEVAGAKPMVGNNKWKVGFNRIPNYGENYNFAILC
jgi:dolichyl-phosphate-mannose--protein O-mannosyl transferase